MLHELQSPRATRSVVALDMERRLASAWSPAEAAEFACGVGVAVQVLDVLVCPRLLQLVSWQLGIVCKVKFGKRVVYLIFED